MIKAKLVKAPLRMAVCVLFGCLSAGVITTISAETIEVAKQGNQAIQTPKNGLKMDDVLAQYGEPMQKLPAVGDPPITRWIYSDFTVYFEYEVVLHSVIHPKKTQQN